MKKGYTIKTISALGLITALAANLAFAGTPTPSGKIPRVLPPESKAFGKTLTDWLGVYWEWYWGTSGDVAQSVVDGVQLMPLPVGEQIGGDWTPESPAVLQGALEITLPAGTPFVLPEYSWVSERYQGWPAVPDDPPMDDAIALASGHPTLTIDGVTVMTDANKANFYVPYTLFDAVVPYPAPTSYGSVAAVAYQGVAFVSPPLPPGEHVIHLYEPLIFPAGAYPGLPDGLGLIYDNTWKITVLPRR